MIDVPFSNENEKVSKQLQKKLKAFTKEQYDFKTIWKTKKVKQPHDDFLHLSFILKISLFSQASLQPSQTSMMEFFGENNKLLSISQTSFIIDACLGSQRPSTLPGDFKPFISIK